MLVHAHMHAGKPMLCHVLNGQCGVIAVPILMDGLSLNEQRWNQTQQLLHQMSSEQQMENTWLRWVEVVFRFVCWCSSGWKHDGRRSRWITCQDYNIKTPAVMEDTHEEGRQAAVMTLSYISGVQEVKPGVKLHFRTAWRSSLTSVNLIVS